MIIGTEGDQSLQMMLKNSLLRCLPCITGSVGQQKVPAVLPSSDWGSRQLQHRVQLCLVWDPTLCLRESLCQCWCGNRARKTSAPISQAPWKSVTDVSHVCLGFPLLSPKRSTALILPDTVTARGGKLAEGSVDGFLTMLLYCHLRAQRLLGLFISPHLHPKESL